MEHTADSGGCGEPSEVLHPPFSLPAPMLSVTQPTPTEESPKTIVPTTSIGSNTPERAIKFAETCTPDAQTRSHRPSLQRANSSFTILKNSFATQIACRARSNKSNESSPEITPQRRRGSSILWMKSSKSKSSPNPSSVIHSPEVQAMIKREYIPTDVNTVTAALEAVNSSPDDSGEEKETCVRQLTALAADLESGHNDCKALLCEAMRARSESKSEICRAKCIEIVHSAYAVPETKVYAYNILATQASLGQASRFLHESEKLVKAHFHREMERVQLLSVITMLRESAKEREQTAKGRKKCDATNETTNRVERRQEWEESGPSMKGVQKGREDGQPADQHEARGRPSMRLDMPAAVEGFVTDVKRTPRSERILRWRERMRRPPRTRRLLKLGAERVSQKS